MDGIAGAVAIENSALPGLTFSWGPRRFVGPGETGNPLAGYAAAARNGPAMQTYRFTNMRPV
jgi:hypothetical protein